MLRFLCCCFSSGENSDDEREPLLQHGPPSEVNGAESARQTRPAHRDSPPVRRIGRLVMRRVDVPELDQRFADMAESFNKQQEHYEAMVEHFKYLKQICSGASNDNLTFSDCVKEIRDEQQGTYRVSLKMKGYDFSLAVDPVRSDDKNEEEPLPTMLQCAQDEIKALSDSAKAINSKHATLQQLIEWLLSTHSQLSDQVMGAAGTYQEQGRLNENLEENFKEVRRAKKVSQKYKKQASDVQTEAAQIAGVSL
ncbi:uncharacterized protein si:ch73-345f18.3 [Kryptolebias marmoratus]|uniref:uncharacterized protein si:ch73-345f18.3 n=1 Tax=Kryptolebias marmoratus TaxID=37003 RepID=UPI0007F8C789|nr:uncharacterized protein si:ch73-345f18.3 [Kryptolebias marmoratus]